MKTKSLAALVITLVLVLAACGPPQEATQTDPGPAPTTPDPPQIYEVGDTVQLGDYKITVNKVRLDSGGEWFGPDEGEAWVVIDCTLENVGDKPLPVSSMLMFDLMDIDGRSQDMTMMADTKGQLDGEIAAGRRMSGEIAYSVPLDIEGMEFVFKGDILRTGQAIFALPELEDLEDL